MKHIKKISDGFPSLISLEPCGYPINDPINHTRRRAVNDDRSCDLEHIGADAEDEAFGFEFDGAGGHGIGKAGDGYEGARAAGAGDALIEPETGEQGGEGDKGDADIGRGIRLCGAKGAVEDGQPFAEKADEPAGEKGAEKVCAPGRAGICPVAEGGIFGRGHFHVSHHAPCVLSLFIRGWEEIYKKTAGERCFFCRDRVRISENIGNSYLPFCENRV